MVSPFAAAVNWPLESVTETVGSTEARALIGDFDDKQIVDEHCLHEKK